VCVFLDKFNTKAGRDDIEKSFAQNGLALLTRNQPECIDHIALSKDFVADSAVQIAEWNIDKTLSDHKGIVVEMK
jgi:hypothetical protein